MSKDPKERKHRRTHRHPESVAFMAGADFDAAPDLATAMGLTDHTPPPWSLDEEIWAIEDNEHNPGQIAAVSPRGGLKFEREANARLIAAAPDLLAALKRLLASPMILGNSREAGDAYADCNRAINKAEGR